jgi:hypothetical protein
MTAAQVFADLRALQDKLAKQRTAAVAQVVVALKAVYPSVEPELVSALADTVSFAASSGAALGGRHTLASCMPMQHAAGACEHPAALTER